MNGFWPFGAVMFKLHFTDGVWFLTESDVLCKVRARFDSELRLRDRKSVV